MHVLSTPPAFILSQDQTLRKKIQKQHHRQPEKPSTMSIQSLACHHQPTRGCGDNGNQYVSNNWHQKTWHTIEFSNNRRFRTSAHRNRGTSLRSNFSILDQPIRQCQPRFRDRHEPFIKRRASTLPHDNRLSKPTDLFKKPIRHQPPQRPTIECMPGEHNHKKQQLSA